MMNQNRRRFLKAAGLAAGSAIIPFEVSAASRAERTPNILVIMSDEHNASVAGCYDNEIAQTANLDGLSRRGITFESCYCNSPLCVPSRLSFTSGKYASRVGAWNNSCWLASGDCPSLPRILNAAGYESILCGKMHYDRTRRYGFREIGGSMNHSRKTGKGSRRRAGNLEPKEGISQRFEKFHAGDESSILSHDRKVTSATVEFLANRKASDKPFFLFVGYLAPHFPLIVPQKYWDRFKGKVPMPKIPEGHLESQVRNYEHHRVAFNTVGVPDEIVQKGRELYYGLTHWLDDEIGKVLWSLADSEVAENTVVIYTTDHGENMGEHGLWWKNCMYEHASRVPLIVSWPSRWVGGERRTRACSLVDVVQTIAELGGADVPADWDGDSMLGWLDDPWAEWKDLAVSEYYGHNVASGFAMIRMGRYKYVYHTGADADHPAEKELYDLLYDPQEFNNLAGQRRHSRRIRDMHEALIKEIGEDPEITERRCRSDCARGYSRSRENTKDKKG
ncbi:MAG: sulfatase-like hydrolase/transferase [Phycisphaerales bacterium]|nr:MAG: sulfatase-like hydrolase/transferase [Phycisphaerales bacterium]